MANRFWVGGAGDGDWSNVNNWSATRGGVSGAAAPVTNDDVFIEELRYPIVVGMDNSTVDLGSLDISMLTGGQIGSAGNSLKIGVSGSSGISGKGGQLHIRSGDGDIFLDATGASSAPVDVLYHSSSNLYITGGTVTLAYVGARGAVTVRESGTLTTVVTCGARVRYDPGSGGITAINVYGGTSYVDTRTITALSCYGGNLVVTGTSACTLATVAANSKLVYGSSGTITTATCFTGGSFTTGGPYPFTVTTSNIYAGAEYFKNSPVAITFTTRNTYGFEE